jgi:hypothetical protein
VQHTWPEPAWIAELDGDRRDAARLRYYLNLAASYYSERGSLPELSEALGLNPSHLNVCRQRGRVSPEMAVKLEELLGRERFPRECFNSIFAVAK